MVSMRVVFIIFRAPLQLTEGLIVSLAHRWRLEQCQCTRVELHLLEALTWNTCAE